jgi:hypothetical protein
MCIVLGLVWLPITATLNMTMAMVSISILLLLTAFLRLRFLRPNLPRRWRVPGGNIGAVIVVIPCSMLCFLNIILGLFDRSNALFGVIAPKIAFVVIAVGFGGLVHLIHDRYYGSRPSPSENSRPGEEVLEEAPHVPNFMTFAESTTLLPAAVDSLSQSSVDPSVHSICDSPTERTTKILYDTENMASEERASP